jgi:hypothetical protein
MTFRGNTKPACKCYRYNGWGNLENERTVCIFDMDVGEVSAGKGADITLFLGRKRLTM